MGRIASKIPNFSLNKIKPLIRVRPPPVLPNDEPITLPKSGSTTDDEHEKIEDHECGKKPAQNKIMVVVDSSMEAKNAVEWTLSHAVRNQDMLILLHIVKCRGQDKDKSTQKDVLFQRRVPNFVTCMKNMCHLKRPEVHVEVEVVEGKEKGETIVKEATRQGVALLILGHKKRWLALRDMPSWTTASSDGVVEYCIQNATCMALAVRRKSKKLGGYLITTRSHKDFWLLA